MPRRMPRKLPQNAADRFAAGPPSAGKPARSTRLTTPYTAALQLPAATPGERSGRGRHPRLARRLYPAARFCTPQPARSQPALARTGPTGRLAARPARPTALRRNPRRLRRRPPVRFPAAAPSCAAPSCRRVHRPIPGGIAQPPSLRLEQRLWLPDAYCLFRPVGHYSDRGLRASRSCSSSITASPRPCRPLPTCASAPRSSRPPASWTGMAMCCTKSSIRSPDGAPISH